MGKSQELFDKINKKQHESVADMLRKFIQKPALSDFEKGYLTALLDVYKHDTKMGHLTVSEALELINSGAI